MIVLVEPDTDTYVGDVQGAACADENKNCRDIATNQNILKKIFIELELRQKFISVGLWTYVKFLYKKFLLQQLNITTHPSNSLLLLAASGVGQLTCAGDCVE